MKEKVKQNLLIGATALALFGVALTNTGCTVSAQATEKVITREAEGIIADCEKAEDDTYVTTIITYDGNYWKISDFYVPLYTQCKVTFDSHGTKTVKDDDIIAIDTHTEF